MDDLDDGTFAQSRFSGTAVTAWQVHDRVLCVDAGVEERRVNIVQEHALELC